MRDAPARLAMALAGRYRIEREIGAGGMATVYLAQDLKHHRKVAIKLLRSELASAVGAERFLAEIRIIANLQHPHILGLIDSGDADGLLYYVMPFVEGESLRARLTRDTQLSIDEAVRIASEVGSALDYAHRHGVVHRDIKPENILLQDGGALVADFGIALALQGPAGERLTETGTSIGTPQYMSPEQAMGGRNLDARSDIYSLGVVLYEMLAGEVPFSGPTSQAVIAKLLTETPTRLSVVRSSVQASTDAAVAQALEKVPADRFRSAADFTSALHRAPAISRPGGIRRIRAGGTLIAALAVAVALWATRASDHAHAVPSPQGTQLTFTGNAASPSLSPDGGRIAYTVQECDSNGTCSASILISDTSGSVVLPVARGFGAIEEIEWSNDGRFLLFSDIIGKREGVYMVSTLGGPSRRLGCCTGSLLDGRDTALLLDRSGMPQDSVEWIRFLTTADGIVRDSIRLPEGLTISNWGPVWGSPDGRRIAVNTTTATHWTLFIIDRSGRLLDSISHTWHNGYTIRWTPSGDALLATSGYPNEPVYDLLRYPVSSAGRFRRDPDTLLRRVAMEYGHVRVGRTGSLVYTGLSPYWAVYAMTRERGKVFRLSSRRLATATGRLIGLLNASGTRVLFAQGPGAGGATALSLMDFDSGPRSPLSLVTRGLEDYDWADDGEHVLLARRRADSVVVSETDHASGQARRIGGLKLPTASSSFFVARATGGGALVWIAYGANCDLHRIGVPDVSDSAFRVPMADGYCLGTSAGKNMALGFMPVGDSGRLLRTSLDSGITTRIGAGFPLSVSLIKWLGDGTILLAQRDNAQSTSLYRVRRNNGAPEHLVDFPLNVAFMSVSDNGQHMLVSATESRTDVFLVNTFRDLLRLRER